MQVKYKTEKHEVFSSKHRYLEDDEIPVLSYFEKSLIEKSAEKTTEMLKRITEIGYVHNKTGHYQSKEFDFVGTQKEKAHRIDKRGTSETLYKTQEENEQGESV